MQKTEGMLNSSRFIGLYEVAGDEFAFYTRAEGRFPKMSMRSKIKSRAINPGTLIHQVCNVSSQRQCWLDTFFYHESPHHKKENFSASEKDVINATDASIIDKEDPAFNSLTQALEVTPML